MAEMIIYDHAWPASFETCPPDRDFADWLKARNVRAEKIFHFGTGEHHHVGIKAAALHNHTIGITASRREMDAYEELVIGQPRLARWYTVIFGDIYMLHPLVLPELDVVTLFHLCEFTDARRADYGGTSDAGLFDGLFGHLHPQGHIVMYPGSMAYDRARPIVEKYVQRGSLRLTEEFRSLAIYQKQGVMR